MNLQPVKPHSIGITYTCHACKARVPDRRKVWDADKEKHVIQFVPIYADLDGPAFACYYCADCAKSRLT